MAAEPTADAPNLASPIVVFSAPGCKYCRRAKQDLAERGHAYADVDVTRDDALRRALAGATGSATVPQIFVNGAHLGGSDDLRARLEDGGFDALLAAAARPLPEALSAAVERAAALAAQASGSGANALSPELRAVADALADPQRGVVAVAGSGAAGEKTFSGAALLAWLEASGQLAGNPTPAALGAALLEANVVTLVAPRQPRPEDVAAVAPEATYRLRVDAPLAVAWGQPLNATYCELTRTAFCCCWPFSLPQVQPAPRQQKHH